MTEYAETKMLVAAMDGDQETLDRLAREATSYENRELTKALNRVYNALVDAERERKIREYGEGGFAARVDEDDYHLRTHG